MAWIGAVVGVVANEMSKPSGGSGGAQRNVDPFSPYRAQYGQELKQLMADPSAVTRMPGFQAELDTGTTNLQRRMAASGQNVSGTEMAGIAAEGQKTQASWFDKQFARLSMLSGASTSPAAGGVAANEYNQQQDRATGQLYGAVGRSIGSIFRGWNNNSGGTGFGMSGNSTPTEADWTQNFGSNAN